MTLDTTASRVSYGGTGTTGPFAYPFRIFQAADLLVTKRSAAGAETTLVLNIDYTVTGAGDASGNVNLTAVLAAGESLYIRRKPALKQGVSIRNQGPYLATTHEDVFDRLTMQMQDLQDQVSRSLKLKETSNPIAAFLELEPEAGKAVVGTGTGFQMSLLDSSAVALPGAGRTVLNLSAYLSNNAVANVKDFGPATTGNGVVDDTAAFGLAKAAAKLVYAPAPAVNYTISSWTLTDRMKLLTDGKATVIKQKAGTPAGTRVIIIDGSHVSVGSCKGVGNIATDAGEQNHFCFVSPTAPIHDIEIGDLEGQDIRGDLLYVGGVGANSVRALRAGNLYGSNIYRNVLSITGGEDIDVMSVGGDSVGFNIFDVEPDPGSSPCRNIHIGYARGAAVSVVGNAANIVSQVSIGKLDMDSAFQTNSVPAYPQFQNFIAFQTRNLRGLTVGHFKANNYRDHALKHIFAGGDVYGENFIFEYVDLVNCSTTEAVFHAPFVISQVSNTKILGGRVTLFDNNKQLAFGDSATPDLVRLFVADLSINGRLAKWVGFGSEFDRVLVNSAFAGAAWQSCQNCTVRNSNITHTSLATFCTNFEFNNVVCTLGGITFDAANQSHYLRRVTINGVAQPNTVRASANGATWVQGELSEEVTLSLVGVTTDTVANLLPANAIIEAVVARVTQTITGSTDWKLGDATTAGRFTAASAALGVGATAIGTVHADQTGAPGPRQAAAAKVRVTTTVIATAGKIRITVFYRQFVAPVS